MDNAESIDLSEISLRAIGERSMAVLQGLNKRKIILSPEGFPRDYRGLAELAQLKLPVGEDPTTDLIRAWKYSESNQQDHPPTLGELIRVLKKIDRWDISDDIQDFLIQDARDYLSSVRSALENFDETRAAYYEELTDDDIKLSNLGFPPQQYDALLLFAEADRRHAVEMYDILKKDYGLKLCLRDSLVAGLPFEHKAILDLISKRCRRVIIIISHHFLRDQENEFYTLFSQSLSIQNGNRIIIPCIYDINNTELPAAIKNIFKLDYSKVSLDGYNYWQKLHDAIIQPPRQMLIQPAHRQNVVIREIECANKQHQNEDHVKSEVNVKNTAILSIQPFLKSSLSSNSSSFENPKKKSKLLTQILTKLAPNRSKKKGEKIALES